MTPKTKNTLLTLAAVAITVVAGVAVSLKLSGNEQIRAFLYGAQGEMNTQQMPSGGQFGAPGGGGGQGMLSPECQKLKELLDSGKGTPEDKMSFIEKCPKPQMPPAQGGGQMMSPPNNMGNFQNQSFSQKNPKESNNPCTDLKEMLNKLSNNVDSEEYKMVSQKYEKHCKNLQPGENPCDALKVKINTFIENGDTTSDEYVKAKMKYSQLCTESGSINDRCKMLTEKMDQMTEEGKTDSVGYATAKDEYMKACQKDVPVAGFEDEVVTTGDEQQNPFNDTNLNSKEGIAAYELYRRGVIGGFADGTFRGDKPVNRAEAAKFLLLARFGTLAGEDGEGESSFKDLKKGEWYMKFVLSAAKKGIIQGYKDGNFKPANRVNTAEFLKMLTLTFDLEKDLPYEYTDVASTDWFAQYSGTAAKYNLFPDRSADNLEPQRELTRREVAVALYQFLLNRE